jgi:hypothetical protein
MRRKLLVKRKNRRRQESLIEARAAFTRLNNRSARPQQQDFINAGYPMVENESSAWNTLHELCAEAFVNEKGQSTYTWFGNRFFFLTDEDAKLFKALWYLV